MKKKIFMACAALVVSAATVMCYFAQKQSKVLELTLANIESITQQELDPVSCQCDKGVLPNKKCLASNKGNRCAQGVNIQCQAYNANCGGVNQ